MITRNYYVNRLKETLKNQPIEDFMQWCYDMLKNVEDRDLTQEGYFEIVNAIFALSGEVRIETSDCHYMIGLKNANLNVPQWRVSLKEN